MADEPDANGSPPGICLAPSETALKIAAILGVTIFPYLSVTGIESLGAGDTLPTVVSRAVGLGVLLVGLGTAFVNAYRGGRLTASVANPLAIAVGLSLFLVASEVLQLNAVEADLPTSLSVLSYLFVGGVVGLAVHFIGRAANRSTRRTVSSP